MWLSLVKYGDYTGILIWRIDGKSRTRFNPAHGVKMENEQKVCIHDYCVLLRYQNHPHCASGGTGRPVSWCTLLTLGPATHDRVSHTVPS